MNNLREGPNRVLITEKHANPYNKEDRIEPTNHIFGIYLLEDIPSKTFIKDTRAKNISSFEDSKKMLNAAFGSYKNTE